MYKNVVKSTFIAKQVYYLSYQKLIAYVPVGNIIK